MSFPNIMFGNRNSPFANSSVATAELGTLLEVGQRKFRYVQNSSAAALDAGKLAQAPAELATAHLSTLSVEAASAGDKYVVLSSGLATSVSTAPFTDGWLIVQNTTAVPGAGRLYEIESLELTSAVTTNRVYLKHGLDKALTSSAEVTLHKNPFRNVIVHPSPPTNKVLGWAQTSLSTGYFGWLCVQGATPAMFDLDPQIGKKVRPSTALDGAVTQDFVRISHAAAGSTAGASAVTSAFLPIASSTGTTGIGYIPASATAAAGVLDAGISEAACGVALTSGVTSAEFGVVWAQIEG